MVVMEKRGQIYQGQLSSISIFEYRLKNEHEFFYIIFLIFLIPIHL
jgi:hypothetical protein